MTGVKVALGVCVVLLVAGLTVGPGFLVAIGSIGAFVSALAGIVVWSRRQRGRDEALFVSMFPDLQPYFHPEKVLQYVQARVKREIDPAGTTWRDPPGFGVPAAEIHYDDQQREVTRLLDAAGAKLAEFIYQPSPEGGIIRVGAGKLTVNDQVKSAPRVRYWNPDREFKWTRQGWKFLTRMSEQPIGGYEPYSSSSDSFTSSSSSGGSSAAAMTGGGGTFDGGGASGSWSEGGSAGRSESASSDSDNSSSTASATSY